MDKEFTAKEKKQKQGAARAHIKPLLTILKKIKVVQPKGKILFGMKVDTGKSCYSAAVGLFDEQAKTRNSSDAMPVNPDDQSEKRATKAIAFVVFDDGTVVAVRFDHLKEENAGSNHFNLPGWGENNIRKILPHLVSWAKDNMPGTAAAQIVEDEIRKMDMMMDQDCSPALLCDVPVKPILQLKKPKFGL